MGSYLAADGSAVLVTMQSAISEGPWDLVFYRTRPDGTLDRSFGDNGYVRRSTYRGGRRLPGPLTVDPQGRIVLGEHRIKNPTGS